MLRVLPVHTLFEQGPYFLRLRVQHRTENKRAEYRVVLSGDANTKPLSDWTTSYANVIKAFDAEKGGD